AHEFAAEAIHFNRHLARINWLPLTTPVLRSHDARAASHKPYLGGSEAIVASVLGDRSDILPFLSIRAHQFMVADSGVLDGPSHRGSEKSKIVIRTIGRLRIAQLDLPACAPVCCVKNYAALHSRSATSDPTLFGAGEMYRLQLDIFFYICRFPDRFELGFSRLGRRASGLRHIWRAGLPFGRLSEAANARD